MKTSAELRTAFEAVRAGEELLAGELPSKPRRPESVLRKAAHDYQTDVDVQVEKRVAELILGRFPDHGVQGEEAVQENPGASHQWYLDPIDGTRNYLEGRPDIAISLALYRDGQPVVGVISMPCRGLVVAADHAHRGLIVNGKPYRRRRSPGGLSGALIAVKGDVRSRGDSRAVRLVVEALAERVEGFRITGAVAYDLACVALGEVAARISVAAKIMDLAAGAFIVAHTGGTVTDIAGNPWTLESRSIVAASTRSINAALVPLLVRAGQK